jgi:hypothetical protein
MNISKYTVIPKFNEISAYNALLINSYVKSMKFLGPEYSAYIANPIDPFKFPAT